MCGLIGKWVTGYVTYRASHLGVTSLKDILTRKWSIPKFSLIASYGSKPMLLLLLLILIMMMVVVMMMVMTDDMPYE